MQRAPNAASALRDDGRSSPRSPGKFAESMDVKQIHLEDTDEPLPSSMKPESQAFRYHIMQGVDQGGKSEILAVRDFTLKRKFARKRIRAELTNNEVEVTRFIREARVNSMLQHPGILPVFDIGKDGDGSIYFSMPLIEPSKNLYHSIKSASPTNEHEFVTLLRTLLQACDVLNYAHSRRVIHRDIKPENILVGPHNHSYLIDWGLAKVWRSEGVGSSADDDPDLDEDALSKLSLTMQDERVPGTPLYMSPEQCRRDPGIDAPTDVHNLGLLLYEIITKQPMFRGPTVRHTMDLIEKSDRPTPSQLAGHEIPNELDDICLGATRISPDDRISLREFTDRLAGVISSLPVSKSD